MPKIKRTKGKNTDSSDPPQPILSTYFATKSKDRKKHDPLVTSKITRQSCSTSSLREKEEFFDQECLVLAKALLGKLLVRQVNGTRLSGFITETECYPGPGDVASHSYNGKRTARNEPMYMKHGTAYVYSIYGIYYCFNISSRETGSCVLIRSLDPYEGLPQMQVYREERRKSPSNLLKVKHLCNGPSKLCQALNIKKETCNKIDMISSSELWLEEGWNLREENVREENVEENFLNENVVDKNVEENVVDKNVEENVVDKNVEENIYNENVEENVRNKNVVDENVHNKNFLSKNVVVCKRIGINGAGEESANKPLRFYLLDNVCISVRDKEAEKRLRGIGEDVR